MRSTVKLLHLVGMAGFLGSLGVCLTLFAHRAAADPLAYVVKHMTLPSLWIILATGLVLTALQKHLAVWVYAKIAIGVVVLFLALFVFAPAVIDAAKPMENSGAGEVAQVVGLVLVALGLGAAVLGIFRPGTRT